MPSDVGFGPRRFFRAIGSLWFSAVLLVLLLIAMACATVYESMRGTEQALHVFYKAQWFRIFLALLGVNVLGALAVRYPFSKRQAGFAIVHLSILVILLGSLVTEEFGVNGQIAVAEGEKADTFRSYAQTLMVTDRSAGEEHSIRLDSDVFGGFDVVDNPPAKPLTIDDLTVRISRYLPDSESVERVVNTNSQPQYALEVALTSRGTDVSAWVFANHTAKLGRQAVEFRVVPDAGELARLLAAAPEESSGMGTVKIEVSGEMFEFPLELCMKAPVPIGDTGRTVRVSKYLPHATVVEGSKLISASSKPENPAIEAELTGPQGTETRRAFAKFPDFATMHAGRERDDTVKLTFVASGRSSPSAAPIAVFLGPEEKLYVRFASEDGGEEASVGAIVATPWPNSTFRVLQLLDHARIDVAVEPVDPPRETRIPAILVGLEAPDSTDSIWVQKYHSRPVTANGRSLQLTYQDEIIPLGFTLELRKFRIGKYPGETRPRSFESHVTVTDPTTAREQSTVISMNNPSKFGGYSLFQSSYRSAGMGSQRMLSILSVARDPGMPIVFVGYFGTMAGMLILLGTRFSQRRRRSLPG